MVNTISYAQDPTIFLVVTNNQLIILVISVADSFNQSVNQLIDQSINRY